MQQGVVVLFTLHFMLYTLYLEEAGRGRAIHVSRAVTCRAFADLCFFGCGLLWTQFLVLWRHGEYGEPGLGLLS